MTLAPGASQIATFCVLCTALYYLFARAEVTRPLWSRYRGWLDALARCPACSGAWIGGLLGVLLSPDRGAPGLALSIVLGFAWGLVLTPLGTWALVAALQATTIAEATSDDSGPEESGRGAPSDSPASRDQSGTE